MSVRIRFRVGPFVVEGDPSRGARPPSRRSNIAAYVVLCSIALAVGLCAIGGSFL